jgi:murein DD-endopeptidase MepM/ murein hydrolase activator NlpD
MMANDYDLIKGRIPDGETFIRGVAGIAGMKSFKELYDYYRQVLTGLTLFPIPFVEGDADISYEDTWYVLRRYGGNRRHEGTDLMASNNKRGYFPVLSITDGIIENIGWLEKGGNRIGIRTQAGGYFYYAHLDSYAPGLKQGDTVYAGQFIGYMGDSGYGAEGTTGKFDVHLHLGIYVKGAFGS